MRFTREYHGRLIVAECGTDLQVQANSLLKLVEEADTHVGGLKDGIVIEFGWAPLKLRTEGTNLMLCEPDYGGDPNHFVPSVDRTLRVLAQQAALLHTIGVEGIAAKYDQGVVLKRDILQLRRLYMHRRSPTNVRDSGWYIGSTEESGSPPDESELDAIPVHRLLSIRPPLLRVMALPYEYVVVFNEDEIEALIDPNDGIVWPVPPSVDEMTQ